MKPFFMLFLLAYTAWAQTQTTTVKFIQVNGSSEMEIAPDEVFISITLKEYKEAGNKIDIQQLEKNLRNVLADMKVDEKNLSIEGSYGYQYTQKKIKTQDFFMSKVYELKLNNLDKFDELIDRLNDKGINQVYLTRTSHSLIEEFKKQVKIKAVKIAKEKADLMLGALGNKAGNLLELIETENEFMTPYLVNARMVEVQDMSSKSYDVGLNMKKIKLKQSVAAKFEIN